MSRSDSTRVYEATCVTDRTVTGDMRYPVQPCGCRVQCGDDGDVDGPGVCKNLPKPPKPPPVEIVLVRRWSRD